MSNQVRTVTYKVQMLTKDAKNEGRAFQTTLTGIGATSNELKSKLQQLGSKITKETGKEFKIVTDKTNGFKDGLKQLTREVSKAERSFESIAREYSTMTQGVNRTADEQERLNAIMRLGKGATLTQKKEVVRLVSEYQRLRGATTGASGSMRNFRGQVNNASYQMQDILVQMQAGTAGFTIFAQQGSQLAASLGKHGPLIGAGVALVGMLGGLLYPALKNNTNQAGELNDKMRELSKTVGITGFQSLHLIKLEKDKIKATEETIQSREDEIKALDLLGVSYAEYERLKLLDLKNTSASTSKRRIEVKSEEEFNEAKNKQIDAYIAAGAAIDTETQKRNEALEAIQLFSSATSMGTDKQAEWIESNAGIVTKLEEQISVYGLTEIEMLKYNKKLDLQTLAQQGASIEQRESVGLMYDQIVAYQEAAKEGEEYEKFLVKLNEGEAERNKILASLNDAGKGTRTAALTKQYGDELSMLHGNLEAQKELYENYNREFIKINGTRTEKMIVSLEEQLNNFDKLAENSIQNFTQGFGQATANAIFNSESLGDAMKGIFVGVGQNMVAFFAEWAAQEFLLWALKKTLGTATQISGATAATANAQATSLQAGLAAFASTAAIPIVGPALAPAAMGTALTITQPIAAAISGISFAGALDKGGRIPQDALGIISEYGDELANGMLVKGPQGGTRVTSREDTAKMMSGNGGGITFNVTGNQQASAEQISRAIMRKLKSKGTKGLDDALYASSERGRRNQGSRYARN